ncbi:hypothetical protein D3C87_512560 [compost metagenome]
MHHGFDTGPHELRGVVFDAVFHARREVLRQFGHGGAHLAGHVQGVGARRLHDAHAHRLLVVQERTQAVFLRVQFHAGDVGQVGHGAVGRGLQDDVAEFFFGLQAAACIHVELQRHVALRGRCADHAGGHLHVLFADGGDDFGRGHAALRDLLRVQPDAHGVVARTPHRDFAHARDAGQAILDVQDRVVAQVGDVVAIIGRDQVDNQRQRGRTLGRGHAQALHVWRQARQRLRHAVLHELLRLVRVDAQLEVHGQRQVAVAVGLRLHVQHVFDAVDGFLQRRGDGFGDDLGVGARILRAHHHRWRHHFRVFGDGELEHGQQARQQHQDGKHAGEDGPVDEEFRDIHGRSRSTRRLSSVPMRSGPGCRNWAWRQPWGRRSGSRHRRDGCAAGH